MMRYIIKGGEFNNKGAEAMSFIAISHIKKNDPNAEIYFYDYGYDVSLAKDLNIIPFRAERTQIEYLAGHKVCKYFLHRAKKIVKYILRRQLFSSSDVYKKAKKIITEADIFIDISGYYLTTRFKDDHVDFYLSWLEGIQKNNPNCKMYLMPQSFGPFDNSFDSKRAYNALSKCQTIFAREQGGYQDLKKLGLENVQFCYDSVLIEADYKPENVLGNYQKYTNNRLIISDKSVAIIPNSRLLDAGGYKLEELINLYLCIIDALKDEYKVYLMPHAGEDIKLCKKIKENYINDDRIVLIDEVLYSFVFEDVVSKMNFIIASRYHSIIHAYRENVPAIILGWSEKYDEVARSFGQSEYLINVDDKRKVLQTIDQMKNTYLEESKKIQNNVRILQSTHNCYSFLGILNESK